MIKVTALQCPKCKDIIYSRTTHDYHTCSCGSNKDGTADLGISVDGGFEYLRCGWANDINKSDIKIFDLEIDSDKDELYDDWNKGIDNFGLIKGENVFINWDSKEDILLEWFWSKIIENIDYELFLEVYNDIDNRNYIVEQLYCMEHYDNKSNNKKW